MRIGAQVRAGYNAENRVLRQNQTGEQVLSRAERSAKTASAENQTGHVADDRQKEILNKRDISGEQADIYKHNLPKAKSIVFWEPDSEPMVLTGTYTGPNAFSPTAADTGEKVGGNPAGDLSTQKTDGPDLKNTDDGCQTCSSRKYQDKSDDMGVSFQMANHINADASASVVMGHEREHERREASDAEENGMKVVATRVRLKMSECPECHKTYASGGETEVLKTKDNEELLESFKNLRDPRYSDRVSEMEGKGMAVEASI